MAGFLNRRTWVRFPPGRLRLPSEAAGVAAPLSMERGGFDSLRGRYVQADILKVRGRSSKPCCPGSIPGARSMPFNEEHRLRRELRAQNGGCNPPEEGATPSRDSMRLSGWTRAGLLSPPPSVRLRAGALHVLADGRYPASEAGEAGSIPAEDASVSSPC
jgi:hypothetical protein